MNTHPYQRIGASAWASAMFLLVLTVGYGFTFAADEIDCVGKPYGTEGCPEISESEEPASQYCGNGIVEETEECDFGRFNGLVHCTETCHVLYCGDGYVSPYLGEECEPETEDYYATDEETGELVREKRYVTKTCGSICQLPSCDDDGNCTGGCIRQFLPVCTEENEDEVVFAEVIDVTPEFSTGALEQVLTQNSEGVPSANSGANLMSVFTVEEGNSSAGAQHSAAALSGAVTTTVASPSCGNGVADLGEACDDGNTADLDACPRDCRKATCGDGIMSGMEQCDDGNFINTDACPNNCKLTTCGNRIREGTEDCDDGNSENADACPNDCRKPVCGDNVKAGLEQCDDGNYTENDGCRNNCTLATCGDGIVDTASEECDDGNQSEQDACTTMCRLASCGDGFLQKDEDCDDGNANDGDSCSSLCQVELCGDGEIQGKEQCDDGNNSDADICTTKCTLAICGDSYVQAQEECDNGSANSDAQANACRTSCKQAYCGDAVVDEGEQCDGGDECTASCQKPFTIMSLITLENIAGTLLFMGGLALTFLAIGIRGKVVPVRGGGTAKLDDVPLSQLEMPWHRWGDTTVDV